MAKGETGFDGIFRPENGEKETADIGCARGCIQKSLPLREGRQYSIRQMPLPTVPPQAHVYYHHFRS
jgi:hypothetical protein